MWYAAVRMDAATARIAFLGPRRLLRRRNCARKYVLRVRAATQATWTSVVLSHGLPGRVRVESRLPALSCCRGQRPAQEIRWPAVGIVITRFDGSLKGREGLTQARLPPRP